MAEIVDFNTGMGPKGNPGDAVSAEVIAQAQTLLDETESVRDETLIIKNDVNTLKTQAVNDVNEAKAVAIAETTAVANQAAGFRNETETLKREVTRIAGIDTATEAMAPIYSSLNDSFAIQRLNRKNDLKVREGAGQALINYTDAQEITKDWTDLSGWTSANAQVSGNKLYAIDGSNPGGVLKSFPISPQENLHVTGLFKWKAGGAGNPIYFGLDFGALDHALAQNSPDGIFLGVQGSGVINKYQGGNTAGIEVAPLGMVGNSTLTVDTTFHFTIDVLPTYVSLCMRNVADPNHFAYISISRSSITTAGKSINNIIIYMQEGRGTAGHYFSPIAAVKSRQPSRTKTLANQTIEGVTPRLMAIPTSSSVAGDSWRIQLPKIYDPRKPSPVVIWHHQSLTGAADNPWVESRLIPLQTALSNAGFIFASASDAGDRWGNQASLDNYRALYEYIRDSWNTGALFLAGASMGALPALNAVSRRELPTPAALVSIGGVCNLDLLWQQSAYDDGIASAYGISGPDAPDSEYETKTAGFNPMDRNGWEFRGVPMRFYSGTSDTVVPTSSHASALALKVAPYTSEASVVQLTGGHLNSGHYNADLDTDSILDIVEFFQTYA